MNGEPLAPRHGFLVRAVVPGVLGARTVKWLARITVDSPECPCFYQRQDYKVLAPNVADMQVAERYAHQCLCSTPESGSAI